jgi:hypothetical protein
VGLAIAATIAQAFDNENLKPDGDPKRPATVEARTWAASV